MKQETQRNSQNDNPSPQLAGWVLWVIKCVCVVVGAYAVLWGLATLGGWVCEVVLDMDWRK